MNSYDERAIGEIWPAYLGSPFLSILRIQTGEEFIK